MARSLGGRDRADRDFSMGHNGRFASGDSRWWLHRIRLLLCGGSLEKLDAALSHHDLHGLAVTKLHIERSADRSDHATTSFYVEGTRGIMGDCELRFPMPQLNRTAAFREMHAQLRIGVERCSRPVPQD